MWGSWWLRVPVHSLYDLSPPTIGVPLLLAPDDIRQMQILDRTVMLRALNLIHDGLIKLYALVQAGLINSIDIDFVKVFTCFSVRTLSVFDMVFLRAVLTLVESLNRSLKQSLYFGDSVQILILVVLLGIHVRG